MQVYDNRRAVDYLLTRPEVDGERLGVTGASGGGNQTMYAGAFDERFQAVVPVCSVGEYQAYLQAACCVCEVLPRRAALHRGRRRTWTGRAARLMVVNATMDSFQFSVGEANKSLERARAIFKLYDAGDKVAHPTFESGHGYHQPMREAMYGWMTRWLKGEGEGKPIPEPKHEIEKVEDLACYDEGKRPATFVFPCTYAGREAKRLLAAFDDHVRDHKEAWEATAVMLRGHLQREVFGDFPKPPPPGGKLGDIDKKDGVRTAPLRLEPEAGMPLSCLLRWKPGFKGKLPACLLLHLDGKAEALKHPLASALIDKGVTIVAPDLRATGDGKIENDLVHGTPDHTSSERAVWIGRPLLGQWIFDIHCLLDWAAAQPELHAGRISVVGIGPAGVVALCAAATADERIRAVAAIDAPATLVTEEPYGAGMRMALMAPRLFSVGDVPHLAALGAPRRLAIVGGVTPQGKKLGAKEIQKAYAFTREVYELYKVGDRLSLSEEAKPEELAAMLVG